MDNHQIKARQVSPLPIGSGGNNTTKQQLNATNASLTMLMTQAMADTKYDPPVPKHITTPITVEHFTSSSQSLATILGILGIFFIVNSFVNKK
jgi:hypothetical protein